MCQIVSKNANFYRVWTCEGQIRKKKRSKKFYDKTRVWSWDLWVAKLKHYHWAIASTLSTMKRYTKIFSSRSVALKVILMLHFSQIIPFSCIFWFSWNLFLLHCNILRFLVNIFTFQILKTQNSKNWNYQNPLFFIIFI